MEFLIKKWSETPINRSKKNNNNKIFTQDSLDISYLLKNIVNYNEQLHLLAVKIHKLAVNGNMGRGDFKSPIMIIGEFPEDDLGEINKILDEMGIQWNKIYITYLYFWKNENGILKEKDLAMTLPYVMEHIKLQQPKLIISLGSLVTKKLLNTRENITSLCGTFQTITFDQNYYYDLFVTFHPSYIRKNNRIEEYKEHFLKIQHFLREKNLYDKLII